MCSKKSALVLACTYVCASGAAVLLLLLLVSFMNGKASANALVKALPVTLDAATGWAVVSVHTSNENRVSYEFIIIYTGVCIHILSAMNVLQCLAGIHVCMRA
jgi:hypothetical protein